MGPFRRRPYASYGLSHRRPSAHSRPRPALLAVAGLGGLLVVLSAVFLSRTLFLNAAPTASLAGGPAATAGAVVQQAVGATAAPAQPTATPTAVVTLRRWDMAADGITIEPALVGQLDQALAGIEGTVSIAVKDLGSGKGAVLNGHREMEAASLFKLPILFSVFEAGLPLTEGLTVSEQARTYDAGTMELGPGETLTVAEALERMVTLSDNTTAIMLGGRVGPTRITRDIAALGMQTTHYGEERMTTSAIDMLDLLELMARGEAVSPTASADMVHLLLRQRVNDRLPRLLPEQVAVAHKTGNLPGVVNDVGLLYGPSSTVAIAALVSDTTNEAAAAAAIARVALVTYTYFDELPDERGRPLLPAQPNRAVPPVWREPRPVVPTLRPQVRVVPTIDANATALPPARTPLAGTPVSGTAVSGTPASAGTPRATVNGTPAAGATAQPAGTAPPPGPPPAVTPGLPAPAAATSAPAPAGPPPATTAPTARPAAPAATPAPPQPTAAPARPTAATAAGTRPPAPPSSTPR